MIFFCVAFEGGRSSPPACAKVDKACPSREPRELHRAPRQRHYTPENQRLVLELTVYVGDIVLDLTPPPPRIPVTNSDGGEFLDPKTDRTCCFCWVGRGGGFWWSLAVVLKKSPIRMRGMAWMMKTFSSHPNKWEHVQSFCTPIDANLFFFVFFKNEPS